MNILPHKSWHVRTRANIARVREDEKKAAKEEEDKLQRIKLAEQEAKINLLRQRTQVNNTKTAATSSHSNEHVNFFNDVESGKYLSKEENKERANEKKEEREKYEKQVGYLTYLGQDTNEILNKRDWYDVAPQGRASEDKLDSDGKRIEVGLKSKLVNDPFTLFRKYTGTTLASEYPKQPQAKVYQSVLPEKREKRKRRRRSSSSCSPSSDGGERSSKHKKTKKKHSKKKSKKKKKKKESKKLYRSSSSSSDDDPEVIELRKSRLEVLRRERLERERVEREKANRLLALARGELIPEPPKQPPIAVKSAYNNQFMPTIARQNQ